MDWSRSKSIFIFVFLILNIFLYSQYIDRYEQGQNVEMPGNKSIEEDLKQDNITYEDLPSNIESVRAVSGKVHNFAEEDAVDNPNLFSTVRDQHVLTVTFREPYKLNAVTKEQLQQFVESNVLEGDSYILWEMNEEENVATFFQRINDRTLFYNDKGYVKVFWDASGNIYTYEQALFEKFEEYEQKKDIMTPIQVINILYSRSLLTANSHIKNMELGYSTLVQLTLTQVFAPTWEVTVESKENGVEKFYVNASDGKVIEMNANKEKPLEEVIE